MSKKLLAIILGIIILPSLALAQTTEDLNASMEAIIKSLEQIAANLPQNAEVFCYNFENNLRVGASGEATQALHKLLEKEGFSIDEEEINADKFGDTTASAVTGFQQKYEADILVPVGLMYGTGSVGSYTRAKLNELYGCKTGVAAGSYSSQVLGAYTTAEDREESGLAMIIEIMSQILDKLGNLLGK